MYFKNKHNRLRTRGVQGIINTTTQLILWAMIDNLRESGTKADYLQVFVVSNDGRKDLMTITHSQEETENTPEYHNTITIPSFEERTHSFDKVKIYCIDDGNAQTMLLAEEY